jgi:hypothetical protein
MTNHPVGYLRADQQEEYEAQQLDEQMTYEKRVEEAEDRDRDIYEQEVTEQE